MDTKFAGFAIAIINTAIIKGGDAENVAALKHWLGCIQRGESIVTAKPPMPEPGEVVPK
jgi:hypothetical protein